MRPRRGVRRAVGCTVAHPLALPLATPPFFMLFSFPHPGSCQMPQLSLLWGFMHAVFSAKNTILSVHSTQLLSSDIFLILQILSLAVPSSRKSSLPGLSAQHLSCVRLRALSPPAIAFNTQAQMVCLLVCVPHWTVNSMRARAV